jgi:Ubiquitin family
MTLNAPPSQTFHALKSRLAEQQQLNPLAIRLLYKNKAISDSKSLHEVLGNATEAQITVMIMKTPVSVSQTPSATSAGSSVWETATTGSTDEEFWGEIRRVVRDRYAGPRDKDEVFEALKKGFMDKFGA